MTAPLEYRTRPEKPKCYFPLILGVTSAVCVPLGLFVAPYKDTINFYLYVDVLRAVPAMGITLAALGLGFGRLRAVAPWLGLIFNLLWLAVVLFGEAGGFGFQA